MTLEQIAEQVRRFRRNTVVAAAFRRALGIPAPQIGAEEHNQHSEHGVYDGMADCFANMERVNCNE